MSNCLPRRAFLGRMTAGLAALTASRSAVPAAAIEPVPRSGAPKFKFSLAAYSYRSLLSGASPQLTLSDFIADCARLQLEGTELTSYYFPPRFSGDYLRQLKSQCFRLGLDVSGTAVRNDFGFPEDHPQRRESIAHVKQWVDHAAQLGAPVIRIFAGHVKPQMSADEAHRLIVAGIEECCDYAGKRGVYLALENHGGPTATVAGLLALVRDVQSPWFGVNLDTGNFHTDDVYGDLAQAAPYAVNVQVKVVVSGPDRQKRPADFVRLAQILRDSGYRGYVVLEYEEGGDPREQCRKSLDQLRQAFA